MGYQRGWTRSRGGIFRKAGSPGFPSSAADAFSIWLPGYGQVLNAGAVASLEDQASTGGLQTLTAAGSLQPTFTAAHASFGGRAVVTNTTATRMSTGTASDYTFLHDGTGSTILWTARNTGGLVTRYGLESQGGGSITRGACILIVSGVLLFRTGNGTNSPIAQTCTGFSANNPHLVIASYLTGDSGGDSHVYVDRGAAQTASNAFTPSSSAPAGKFCWGGYDVGGTFGWEGQEGVCVTWKRVLTSQERTDWGNWCLSYYGF
jgi:hypothetical protein